MLAVRHDCVCGHAFLICVATDHEGFTERPTRWPALVRAAARRIGATYIEAEGNTRFSCTGCGAVLLLLTPPPPSPDVAYSELAPDALVASLN